ncbi:MAG: aminotransferase class IV, partial [Fimbriimonadaceae bacterium]|nr:aminotransferase class IV [Alphaproteobacteria bacterium]
YRRDDVEAILHRLVALTELGDAYVSMTASRGPLPRGSRNPLDCRNRLYAFAIPFSWIAPYDEQTAGVDLIVATPPRIPPDSVDPTIKNYHWGDLNRGLFEAIDQGARAAIHLDRDGNVTEGAGFNIFALKDGVIRTPESGVLLGITRRTVIEIATTMGLEVEIAPTSLEFVQSAEEILISSTAGGVIPVRSLDGKPVGQGSNWSVALEIRETYWKLHDDPAYTTPVNRSLVS